MRDIIFPSLQNTQLWHRDEEINKYLKETQKCLERFFPSIESLIKYINGFDRPEYVEVLMEVCRFYNVAKNHACHPFLKFIMMISIFERLSCNRYLSFYNWLVMRENRQILEDKIGKIIDYGTLIDFLNSLYQDYIVKHGLKQNLLRFFEENLTEDEKIKLIRSFHIRRTKYLERAEHVLLKNAEVALREYANIDEYSRLKGQQVDEKLLPYCYDWKKCYIEYGRCCPDINCPLKDNREALTRELRRVINIIYNYRSMFVHRAKSPPFPENGVNFVIDIYENAPIVIHLNLSELQEMLENSLKRYFDKLCSESSVNS